MLFLKYISDVWQDHYDDYKKQYGDAPELIEAMMALTSVCAAEKAPVLRALYERRHEPGNGEAYRSGIACHRRSQRQPN